MDQRDYVHSVHLFLLHPVYILIFFGLYYNVSSRIWGAGSILADLNSN